MVIMVTPDGDARCGMISNDGQGRRTSIRESKEEVMNRATIVLLGAWAAMLVALAPGAAAADCTGITSGDFTFFNCTDGSHFTEQRIGDFTYLSGDVNGWGQQIGNIEYWHLEPNAPAVPVVPVVLPGVLPGTGVSVIGWEGWE
jgi:hypothetical protein